MSSKNDKPTPEMILQFERRTSEHIKRVRNCLVAMAAVTPDDTELIRRSFVHDASKYSPEERLPYIWLTEYHRCRRNGEPFEYPSGMDELVRQAVDHHVRSNRHHPEFHADPNDMTDEDLIEMVCDWTAMAQEFGENNGSAKQWANMILKKRLRLNSDRQQFVYSAIELLDKHLGIQP
jgi:Family of unknown function (DUF5662)